MVAILKFILWRIGSQWRSARTDVAKARFLGNDPSKCVLDKLQASQILNSTCQPGESYCYSSRVSNPLLRQLLSCKPQWWGKNGCDGVHECASKMPCMFRKPVCQRTKDILESRWTPKFFIDDWRWGSTWFLFISILWKRLEFALLHSSAKLLCRFGKYWSN